MPRFHDLTIYVIMSLVARGKAICPLASFYYYDQNLFALHQVKYTKKTGGKQNERKAHMG